jgi:hypothetical protein
MQVRTQHMQAIGHLSKEACARTAKQFNIEHRQEELFNLLAGLRRRYERSLLMPDHHQRKDTMQQLSKALGTAAANFANYHSHLEGPIYEGILPLLGELLSQHGLEKLIGTELKLPRDVDHERISIALQAGPDLIVSLFNELRRPVDDALAIALLKRGRPRHNLYRDFVIQELGRNYQRFFGKPSTASITGHFARFCRAILEELKCDLAGFARTFPVILKAIGVLKKTPVPIRRTN